MNGLATQPRELRPHQQRTATRFGMQCSDMAKVAFGFIELPLTFDNLFVIHIATGRYTQALQIEVYVLHILR